MLHIQSRGKKLVNTDPQRRCYNGCHYSSELVDTPWEIWEYNVPPDKAEERLSFWEGLNDYAVSQRGSSAKREFRIKKD